MTTIFKPTLYTVTFARTAPVSFQLTFVISL